MKDLIVITKQQIGSEEVNSVDARGLHEFLEVKTKFADWITRQIKQYNFVINSDFCAFMRKSSGGRRREEYAITIDMAKELSMVEKNQKGKEARQYFIENELMIFEDNEVEVFELNEIIYFNPRDVGKCLNLTNSAIRDHTSKMNDKQLKKLTNSDVCFIHIRKLNNAGENFLTESGVYKLVFKSRKPKAEKFQDWITDEVLPAIRKTGGYIIDKPEDTPEEILARAVLIAQDTIKRKDEKINQLQIKTVRQKRKLIVQKPKVEYYDKVLDSSSDFTTGQIAKEVEMSSRGLNTLLFQEGVQFKQSGQWLLKKEYQGKGLVKTRTHLVGDGRCCEKRTTHSTVWTERGRLFIIELLEDI